MSKSSRRLRVFAPVVIGLALVASSSVFGGELASSMPTLEIPWGLSAGALGWVQDPVAGPQEQGVAGPEEEPESFGYLSAGFRFGAFQFDSSPGEDGYESLVDFGGDFYAHLGNTWLLAGVNLDVSVGANDDPEPRVLWGQIGTDAAIAIVDIGLSIGISPPPGLLGTPDGSFYVNPYVAAGPDLVIVSETIEVRTIFGKDTETESDVHVGLHATAGIDFVFERWISFGGEFQYRWAEVENVAGRDVDIDGMLFLVTLRFHF